MRCLGGFETLVDLLRGSSIGISGWIVVARSNWTGYGVCCGVSMIDVISMSSELLEVMRLWVA